MEAAISASTLSKYGKATAVERHGATGRKPEKRNVLNHSGVDLMTHDNIDLVVDINISCKAGGYNAALQQ